MGKWKKIIAISVVIIMMVSAVSVYMLYFNVRYCDIEDLYFDIRDADDVGICTVESRSNTLSNAMFSDVISLNTMSADSAVGSFFENNNNGSNGGFTYLVPPLKGPQSNKECPK